MLNLEAQIKELEAELESSRDSITELGERVDDHEAEIVKKEKYIVLLEECFAESITTSLR